MRIENDDIKLVFFSSKFDRHFERLSNVVPRFFPNDNVFHCNTISEFSNTLKDILFGRGIVLVVIRNKNELNGIYQMSERLKDHSIIVILAERIDEMSQHAIRLYPRYTTYIKDDYNDVSQVLERMIKNIENKIKGERHGRFNRFN